MNPIKAMLNNLYQALVRTLGFAAKEILYIFHQPRLVFSLILGPFLILLIFGLGYRQNFRTLDIMFVVPENSEIARRLRENIDRLPDNFNYLGMTPDADEADGLLRAGEVDLVVVVPTNPVADWNQNSQANFIFYHNEIDPTETGYIQTVGQRSIDLLNQELLEQLADEAKKEAEVYRQDLETARDQTTMVRRALEQNDTEEAKQAVGVLEQNVDLLLLATGTGVTFFSEIERMAENSYASLPILARLESIQQELETLKQLDVSDEELSDEIAAASQIESDLETMKDLMTKFQGTDSEVLIQPFADKMLSVTRLEIEPTHFYIPAVLSLLLQHIAVTMAGLSLVREQKVGSMELFRAAPVSSLEILLGKYIGFLLLIGLVTTVLTLLIVWGLGAPMMGSWGQLSFVSFLLLSVSLGLGFHVSLSSASDSQAIQTSMIVLLASIFFSGFFLPLYRLRLIADFIAWMLPATYSTLLLKDVMLRGQAGSYLLQALLILFSTIFLLSAWWRLHRRMRQE